MVKCLKKAFILRGLKEKDIKINGVKPVCGKDQSR
jgi:hypothetical protein